MIILHVLRIHIIEQFLYNFSSHYLFVWLTISTGHELIEVDYCLPCQFKNIHRLLLQESF